MSADSGFQIRHKEMGVFQGEFLGMAFWHPMSEIPEQGFLCFKSKDIAEQYVRFLAGKEPHYGTSEFTTQPLNVEDLTVEPFDYDESDRLIEESQQILSI